MSPSKPYFGGKAPAKLVWTPLPLMDAYLETLDDKSESYLKVVKKAFAHFALFCAEEDIRHPEELERKHLNRYDAWLRTYQTWLGRPMADSTRALSLRYVKTWVTWCFRKGYLPEDLWAMIKLANPKPKKPRSFHEEELIRVFETHKKAAFLTTPFFYHRREVILALLYGWGLRIGELPPLTVTALDVRLNEVKVKKANGMMKTLPFGDELKGIIQRWLRVRGSRARRGEDALLIDQSGFPITEIMIAKILKDLGSKAGVDLTPSRFRDNFGLTVIGHDVDVDQVAKMLGLESNNARRFTMEHDEELKQSYDFIMDPLMGRYFGGRK